MTEHDLILACKDGNLDKVKYLVEDCGVSPVSANNTSLYYAIWFDHKDICKYLVEDCKVNVRSWDNSAIRWASQFGKFEILKFFVDNYDTDLRDDEDFALRFAIKNSHWQIVLYILSKINISSETLHKMIKKRNKKEEYDEFMKIFIEWDRGRFQPAIYKEFSSNYIFDPNLGMIVMSYI